MSEAQISWVAIERFREIINESNPFFKEYGEIMDDLAKLKIPLSASTNTLINPNKMYKECNSHLDSLKNRIKNLENQILDWQTRATKVYAEPNFPVGLDHKKTELFFHIQQNFNLHRMSQLSDALRTLYSSINTKTDELQSRMDNAHSTNLFAYSIIVAWVLFILSNIIKFR